MPYAPKQNPACTQPKAQTINGATWYLHTVEDTCEDVDCCYCHGCEYNDEDVNGWPVCEICGEHYEHDDEPVRD